MLSPRKLTTHAASLHHQRPACKLGEVQVAKIGGGEAAIGQGDENLVSLFGWRGEGNDGNQRAVGRFPQPEGGFEWGPM